MAKRTYKTSLPEDLLKYTKYKWEFLRRNPEFISDYEEMLRQIEENYGDEIDPDAPYTKEEVELAKKWKVSSFLRPTTSFDDFVSIADKEKETSPKKRKDRYMPFAVEPLSVIIPQEPYLDIPKLLYQWLFPEFLPGRRPIDVVDGYEMDSDGTYHYLTMANKVADTGRITIEIDLNYSKSFLKNQFSIFIDTWKDLYEKVYKNDIYWKFCKERGIREHPLDEKTMKEFDKIYQKKLKKRNRLYSKKKYHFENFDLYLQVYDLREQGNSWAEIVSELDLYDIQTARNHYKAACKLIDKGIELYVK